MPRQLTPFRAALTAKLTKRINTGPIELLRVVLCLYGGVPFRDTRRWNVERARLDAILSTAVEDAAASPRDGAPLAKLELAIALEVLARRFPDLRLASNAPATYKKMSQFRALESLWVCP